VPCIFQSFFFFFVFFFEARCRFVYPLPTPSSRLTIPFPSQSSYIFSLLFNRVVKLHFVWAYLFPLFFFPIISSSERSTLGTILIPYTYFTFTMHPTHTHYINYTYPQNNKAAKGWGLLLLKHVRSAQKNVVQ
jgi:hypothetical protein